MKESTKTTKPILLSTTSIHVYLYPPAGIINTTVSEHISIPHCPQLPHLGRKKQKPPKIKKCIP